MERIEERIRWLNIVRGGRWQPKWADAIPTNDEGAFDLATESAKRAVAAALQPSIAAAEAEYESAERERDRFARGR